MCVEIEWYTITKICVFLRQFCTILYNSISKSSTRTRSFEWALLSVQLPLPPRLPLMSSLNSSVASWRRRSTFLRQVEVVNSVQFDRGCCQLKSSPRRKQRRLECRWLSSRTDPDHQLLYRRDRRSANSAINDSRKIRFRRRLQFCRDDARMSGTSSRSYFTLHPVTIAELMPKIVSSVILFLTFFLQNAQSQIIHWLSVFIVFLRPLSSLILYSPAPPYTLFRLLFSTPLNYLLAYLCLRKHTDTIY